jgi:hypothetical protein
MAFSENNAKEKDLKKIVARDFPGCFVKSNRPYNKGALLIDKQTGEILESEETNYRLFTLLTRPGYMLVRPTGFLPDSEIMSFDHAYKTELWKLEDSINDSVETAKEWAQGKELRLMYDYELRRFRFFVDNQAAVRRSK